MDKCVTRLSWTFQHLNNEVLAKKRTSSNRNFSQKLDFYAASYFLSVSTLMCVSFLNDPTKGYGVE